MKVKKYVDGGIGPNKKRKAAKAAEEAAEAAKRAEFEKQLANAVPSWQRAGAEMERRRALTAEMRALSEKEGISMDEAYVRLNEDNWVEDPNYEARMARIKAAKGEGGGGSYANGGKMKVKKYKMGGPVDPPKKTPTEGGWTSPTRAKVSGDTKGELNPRESLELMTKNELIAALAKRGARGPQVSNAPYAKIVKMAKEKDVYQPARMAAVASWRKKYGSEQPQ